MTNPHPLTEVEVLPLEYISNEMREEGNRFAVLEVKEQGYSCRYCSDEVELRQFIDRVHRPSSTQPSTEAVKLAAFDLMQEFYVSRYYEPKPERPADNIQAAIEFVLDRQPPPLTSGDEVERVAKLHAFERRSVHDSARDADHYWENLGAETQTAELKAARATIAALSNMRGTNND